MDISQREGKYPVPPGASQILGVEFSGHVAELGSGVSEWKTGDEVFGLTTGVCMQLEIKHASRKLTECNVKLRAHTPSTSWYLRKNCCRSLRTCPGSMQQAFPKYGSQVRDTLCSRVLELDAYRPWLERSASCIGNDATLKPDSDPYLHNFVHETTF